jgi:predicted Zn-dependent peptidase
MKNLLVPILFISFVFNIIAQEKADFSKKPDPIKMEDFKFPDYKEKTLSNGLKVFYIVDQRLPVVSMNLMVYGGSSVDSNLNGMAGLVASLLTKGSTSFNAEQIAAKIEGTGSSIGANAGSDYITVTSSGLLKHKDLLLQIYSEVITAPLFPKSEFKKEVANTISRIQYEKSNPMQLADALVRKAVYGAEHPYAGKASEATINEISVDDLKAYHTKYFVPQNATLAVVGDIDIDSFTKDLEKAFSKWQYKGELPVISIPTAKPMPFGVYFIKRPASVQSTVLFGTLGVPYADKDFEVLDLAADLMGTGFASRLQQTLREKHSYTYGAFGYLTEGKFTNRFVCGASVRNSVTDSSIAVIIEQIRDLGEKAASEDEVNRMKNYTIGKFKMSFEDPGFMAQLIQKAEMNGVSIDRMKNFISKRNAISPFYIMNAAKKYMNPVNSFIIVVGSQEVKDKLARFGTVYEYDSDLKPLTGVMGEYKKVSLKPQELLDNYIKALGGAELVNGIKCQERYANVVLVYPGQPELTGSLKALVKTGNKLHQVIDMGVFSQESWVNGDSSWTKSNSVIETDQGTNKEKAILSASIFPALGLMSANYKLAVLGEQEGLIVMHAQSPLGSEFWYYFDKQTYLLSRKESYENTPQGQVQITELYNEYKKFDGISVPVKVTEKNPYFEVRFDFSYKFNVDIDDNIFSPRQ